MTRFAMSSPILRHTVDDDSWTYMQTRSAKSISFGIPLFRTVGKYARTSVRIYRVVYEIPDQPECHLVHATVYCLLIFMISCSVQRSSCVVVRCNAASFAFNDVVTADAYTHLSHRHIAKLNSANLLRWVASRNVNTLTAQLDSFQLCPPNCLKFSIFHGLAYS